MIVLDIPIALRSVSNSSNKLLRFGKSKLLAKKFLGFKPFLTSVRAGGDPNALGSHSVHLVQMAAENYLSSGKR